MHLKMTTRSILLLLFYHFNISYGFNTSTPDLDYSTTQLSTYQPSRMPTVSPTLDVTALNQYGECNNPADAKSRLDFISLSRCIDLCEKDDCVMIQYYDKLQSNADSRCYIFDQICDLSQNVGKRANSSHIYFKNQFTTNYCVDYRDWKDKYLDDCNAYVTHGLCLNGEMTGKTTVDRFEEAKDPIYNWNALEACCECGGGKYVYDNVAVTYMNKYNLDDEPKECSFKNDTESIVNLAQWNNFALKQLMEGINYPLNSDVLIYKYLSNVDATVSYTLDICNFSSYDINITEHDIYTDFFIFAAIEYIDVDEYVYFINSEYFNIDLNVISSILEVEYYSYQDCNTLIVNASLDDNSVLDMILPCFNHYTPPTTVPTEPPEIEKTTEVTEITAELSQSEDNEEEIETFLDIYGYYTINENNWIYAIILCAALCVLITFCLFCCIKKCKKKKMKKKTQQHQTLSNNNDSNNNDSNNNESKNELNSELKLNEEYKNSGDEYIRISMDKRPSTLYFQRQHYDKHQITNIKNRWSNNPKGPKLIFGDNIVDKKRGQEVERQKYANQSTILGHVDRTFGFGIPTTFENAQSVGFVFNDHNYRTLLKFEFDILKQHLSNGGDVVVPLPSDDDIRKRPHKYKQNGKGQQIIHHNIGTGISKLEFKYLRIIEEHICSLKETADKTERLDKVLYDDNEYDDNEYETDEKEDSRKGLLVFQQAWYNEEQMKHIFSKHYEQYKRVGSTSLAQPPKMLFGDNDVDNQREDDVERLHNAGQAKIMGSYDRSLGYGIITTFYKLKLDKGAFMILMDDQFKFLHKHLTNGNDVVVPKPTKNDVIEHSNRYCINGQQKISHNLGTGIAQLPFSYLQYIQYKVDELRKYARDTKTVKYYCYSPKRKSQKMREQVLTFKSRISNVTSENNDQTVYECPACPDSNDKVHYLMKFKNCKHTMCERCLAGYILEHLNYSDHVEDFRFKCWVSKTGKCPNGIICLEDVDIPDDKCYCDECKQRNTDTGNGTILDDESYKQFKYIMDAFGTKSLHDIQDECPNPECKKPFQIRRPWRHKEDKVTNGYYYERKTSFFDDIEINPNECNCCGKKLTNELLQIMDEDFDEMEEIATTAYQTTKNCRICQKFYCDTCRSNCFYEIDRNFTVRPPTPVNEAMMQFHAEQKLKKHEIEMDTFERFHSNHRKGKVSVEQNSKIFTGIKEAFECCEVCWYRFYGRQCPHCNHRFCCICNGEWNGCTADWKDKVKNFHHENDDEKYGADNLYTLIDEKNGKHNRKAHHSCSAEELKLKKKEMRRKKSKQIFANKQKTSMIRKLNDAQLINIDKERKISRKEEEIKRLKNERKQTKLELVALKTEKNAEIKELQHTILKLQHKKLTDKSNVLQHKLVTTEDDKKRILKQKENAENQSKRYKLVAEEEEKKRKDKEEELIQFRKKLFVNAWKWKDNAKWVSYDEDMNQKIEALNSNGGSLIFKVDNKNYKITRTDECKGIQENTGTKYKRDMKRFEVGRGYIRYPKFWNMEGFDLGNDEGGLSTGLSYAEPRLVQLDITKSPAKEVASAFYTTSRNHYKYKYVNIKIISIESVQNQRLYDKYWRERSSLKREIGKNKLNEKNLWHGTRAENVLDLIKKEGFRREFNKTYLWGQGSYFAVNAGYSVSYASNNNGVRKMFQTKVLCGESDLGKNSYLLTSWPKKKNGLMYDSLHSKENDIYVIHDDTRAYPMFVVTFKMN